MADAATWELAAEVARALANASWSAGVDLYKPIEFKDPTRTKSFLGLGDCGAIEAIRLGDPAKMQAALAELKTKA